MTGVDVPARSTETPEAQARWMHVTFIVVWGLLLLGAAIAFFSGITASRQTFDSGPLTHEAQAGVDFLACGILAATGIVVVMIQLGARVVQLTIRGALAGR